MKYNKIRYITFIIIVVLITIILVPNGVSEKAKLKTRAEDPDCFGTIHGHTHMSYCWSWNPVPLAKVRVGLKSKLSGVNGYFIFTGLVLGKPYVVSANKIGYSPDSKIVILTIDDPIQEVNLDLQKKEDTDRTKDAKKDTYLDLGLQSIFDNIFLNKFRIFNLKKM